MPLCKQTQSQSLGAMANFSSTFPSCYANYNEILGAWAWPENISKNLLHPLIEILTSYRSSKVLHNRNDPITVY